MTLLELRCWIEAFIHPAPLPLVRYVAPFMTWGDL